MFKQSIVRHLSSSCAFAAPIEASAGGVRTGKTSVPSAGKSPFAHLARGNAKAAEDDDKDDKKKDAKDESEGEEDDEEDEDKKSKKSKKAKKAKKAEDGDDDMDDEDAAAEDDEECEEEDDDKKKSKKSKKADDGDDDSDREDDDDPEARAARARERGRIRAIVISEAGKLNPVGAMELACGTSMSRRQAIGTLRAMGVPIGAAAPRQTDALRSRMAGVETPEIGSGDARPDTNANPVNATAAAIIAAGKKRRGEKD